MHHRGFVEDSKYIDGICDLSRFINNVFLPDQREDPLANNPHPHFNHRSHMMFVDVF